MNGNSNTKLSKLLLAVIALQLVTLAGQWLEGPRMLPTADAQLANVGADRQAMIDELKRVNQKLDKLTDVLSSGNLQVKVVNPDEHKKDATASAKSH